MNLLAPAALALAVVAAPIVAMYILKMRRPTRIVPSAFLWEQALHDVQANAPWQRLRPNLLLLLQLLAVAALVLALARPYTLRAALAQGDVVVVLDASVLMRATDVAPSRFAAARRRIDALIDGLDSNSVMSIVLMARRPRVLIAQSGDRAALHAALAAAVASYETPDPTAALSAARALMQGAGGAGGASGAGSSLFVYAAAGGPAVPVPAGLAARTHVETLGDAPRDLGVVSFAASRAADGTVTTLARIANLGRRPASSDLQLDVATGDPSHLIWRPRVDLRPVTLGPGQSTVVIRTRLPAGVVAVRTHLAAGDDLEADDWAWAVVPSVAPRRVLLATPGNTYLSLALALVPGVQLNTVSPDGYSAARARCVDAVVFDGWLPSRLPGTAVVAVAPPSGAHSPLDLTVGRPVTAAGLQVGDDPDGLLRNAGVGDVAVDRATPLEVPVWANAVLRTRGQPVLVAGQDGPRREAVLGFQVYDSSWVVAASFPIFVRNLLDWLAPPATALTGVYRPGDAVPLVAASCATSVAVTGPSGARRAVAPPFPAQPFVDTARPGLYILEQGTPRGVRRGIFAVNLFPVPSAPTTAASTGATAGVPLAHTARAQIPVEWAPLVAAIALALLCGEWWVAAARR